MSDREKLLRSVPKGGEIIILYKKGVNDPIAEKIRDMGYQMKIRYKGRIIHEPYDFISCQAIEIIEKINDSYKWEM